jgi:hypothetical protein
MYFPRNWEFGSAFSTLWNNFGGGFEPPKPPVWVRQCAVSSHILPHTNNNFRTSESQHVIMFDINVSEEFGTETQQVKELANQLNINYKFHHIMMQM